MNYELIMLKNAVRMKHTAAKISDEITVLAMHSYDTSNWRNGTAGQMQAVAELLQQKEVLNDFYSSVYQALGLVPKPLRALLVAVYIKGKAQKQLAARYGVSAATVYRKLCLARESFRQALTILGCDEQWFQARYGGYDWIVRREQRNCGSE